MYWGKRIGGWCVVLAGTSDVCKCGGGVFYFLLQPLINRTAAQVITARQPITPPPHSTLAANTSQHCIPLANAPTPTLRITCNPWTVSAIHNFSFTNLVQILIPLPLYWPLVIVLTASDNLPCLCCLTNRQSHIFHILLKTLKSSNTKSWLTLCYCIWVKWDKINVSCRCCSMYTCKIMYFPSFFSFPYTKVATLSPSNCFTWRDNFPTACKSLRRLRVLARTSDLKKTGLYRKEF